MTPSGAPPPPSPPLSSEGGGGGGEGGREGGHVPAVVRAGDRTEGFLAGCVPDL